MTDVTEIERRFRAAELSIGDRFTRLVIIGLAAGNHRGRSWHCRCDCGTDVRAQESALVRGTKRSCGCLKAKPSDDFERIRLSVSYDPETGLFRRRRAGRDRAVGEIATSAYSNGYLRVFAAGRELLAHRLAWRFANGHWPDDEIDHINLDRTDNRISNLRLADRRQNIANTGSRSRGISKLKGASFRKDCRLHWEAKIVVNGIMIRLGRYETEEEAHLAYMAKARDVYGEFARAG